MSDIHYRSSIFGKDTDISLSLCLLSLFGFKAKKFLESCIFSLCSKPLIGLHTSFCFSWSFIGEEPTKQVSVGVFTPSVGLLKSNLGCIRESSCSTSSSYNIIKEKQKQCRLIQTSKQNMKLIPFWSIILRKDTDNSVSMFFLLLSGFKAKKLLKLRIFFMLCTPFIGLSTSSCFPWLVFSEEPPKQDSVGGFNPSTGLLKLNCGSAGESSCSTSSSYRINQGQTKEIEILMYKKSEHVAESLLKQHL